MKVLHLLVSGNIGGIEVLCRNFVSYSKNENMVLFLRSGQIAKEMENDGNIVVDLNLSPRKIFKVINKVISICRKESVDVLIAHHASPVFHLCLMVAKRCMPHIFTIAYAHSNAVGMYRENEKKSLFFRKLLLSKSLSKVDKVVAISYSVRQSLMEKLSVPSDNILVIYNGIDINKFHPINKNNDKVLEIVYVGRLIEDKGVQIILKALSTIEKKYQYHMKIVGDGPYLTQLIQFAKDYQVEEKVSFLGNQVDVSGILAESDIFIHTPLLEEGFGITVVEAMASGLTCICSRSGAISEIIDDKFNGYLIEKNNALQLRELLVEVLQNYYSEYNCKMRQSAVEKAQAFSIYNYVNLLDDLIVNRRAC